MPYFVYIIQSESDQTFYKGFSEDYAKRLIQHNNAECHYTSLKIPWKLVHVEEHPTKRSALIREKNLKKATRERILALISSPKNLLRVSSVGWNVALPCANVQSKPFNSA